MKLTLESGFCFDYTNLMGENGVSTADMAELQPRLATAHEAVLEMRRSGLVRGHLSKDGEPELVLFSQLPYVAEDHLNSPASIAGLKAFGQRMQAEADAVVSFGIGGSYLGNKVLFDVHCGEFWNQLTAAERRGYPKLYFSGNNIDARRTSELLKCLKSEAGCVVRHNGGKPYRVVLIVISKSGSTLDTMSNFMLAYDQLRNEPNIALEIVAVTDPNEQKPTLLKQLAVQNGWQTFSVPDGVGGRFSVFCDVGLITAACIGFDIDQFLAGARAMDRAAALPDVWQNPAMLNAALKYLAAAKYGKTIEVLMPYADYLKSTAEWYVQLLAESLGKQKNRQGKDVFYGRTPIVAVGTTDMHAQTQQHQEGALNKLVQFIKVDKWADEQVIPNVFPQTEKLAKIAGISMSRAMNTALQANAAALTSNSRLSAEFILPELNAYHLGELMYMLAMSVAYEGELADVDAFDQPGVEAYKRIMGASLKTLA